MKKYIFYIVLMSLSYVGLAQELTPPQVEGYVSGSTIKVGFPFAIKGVPFSQIPGSVWYSHGRVIAELQMSYYMEGDDKMYVTKLVKSVNPRQTVGSWALADFKIEPKPYPIPNRNVVSEKTTYLLSVYQNNNYKSSKMWYANIVLINPIIRPQNIPDQKLGSEIILPKIPDQKKGPIKVHPKDKVILNPQPIPPKIKSNKYSGQLNKQ
ncbi:hypothetical protein [Pedobacter frigoris]|uniref:Uncharacterized protein n=1 Tax=Pedobacter frigoris TaxID=2571272 RepID=A0A4U1CQ52_9SPHI|nr:hypothetical protein [Pedobacter frigoris]TKC08935.1 hypothetical protein FA047_02230 [Pedobacter frigoris]